MQRLIDNKDPVAMHLIEATPEQLRKIADKLEAQLAKALPGESIIIQIAQDLTLVVSSDKINRISDNRVIRMTS